jgi:hypothetical protein
MADHISRVKSASSNLNDNEKDIIERLASLDIPNGIKLILGTQPGEHLDPILKRRKRTFQLTIYLIGLFKTQLNYVSYMS